MSILFALLGVILAFVTWLFPFSPEQAEALQLPLVRELKRSSFKLGDDAAANFPFLITPVQDAYNAATQALLDASFSGIEAASVFSVRWWGTEFANIKGSITRFLLLAVSRLVLFFSSFQFTLSKFILDISSLLKSRRNTNKNEIDKLHELVNSISNSLFDQLIDLLIGLRLSSIQNKESGAEEKERLNADFSNWLNNSIVEIMKEEFPSDDAANALAAYFRKYVKAFVRFTSFTQELNIIFSRYKQEKESFASVLNHSHEQKMNIFSLLKRTWELDSSPMSSFVWLFYKDIPKYIALAIQANVIATPQRIKRIFSDIQISDKVEECLIDILKDIEFIRTP